MNTRTWWLLLGCAVVLAIAGWCSSAYQRGMTVAWLDQARGHRELKIYGLPPGWDGEYARLLQSRYGVVLNPVAGCVVPDRLAAYVDGYNAVSRPRIEAHFGRDVFAECAEDARMASERGHPAE